MARFGLIATLVVGCHGNGTAPNGGPDALVAIDAPNATPDAGIAIATGSADSTFGSAGTLLLDFGGADTPTGLVQLADGTLDLSVDTVSTTDGTSSDAIVHLSTDGVIDASFGSGGRLALAGGGTLLGAQPGGALLISTSTGIERLLADGTRDLTFGPGGVATFSFGAQPLQIDGSAGQSIAIDPSGRIYLMMRTISTDPYNSNGQVIVARSTADGDADGAFGQQGFLYVAQGLPIKIAFQHDGSPLVALESTPTTATVVERLTDAGAIDVTYGHAAGGGYFAANNGPRSGIAVDASDRATLGGDNTAFTAEFVGRLTAAGDPDPAYGTGGGLAAPGLPLGYGLTTRPSGGCVMLVENVTASPPTAQLVAIDDAGTHATVDTTEVGAAPLWHFVVELPDRRLLAIGTSDAMGGASADVLLARFEP